MLNINSIKRCMALTALALSGLVPLTTANAAPWALTGALESHDPSIYKEGSTWWIFETSTTGIGVKYSANGLAWTQGGSIFPAGLSWWNAYNGNTAGTWAPDIHDWNGKAIAYYAVSTFGSQNSAIGLVTATSIAKGDWVDQGAIITSRSGDNYNAIDPNFFVDTSGQPWLTFGSWQTGIYTTKVDSTTLKPTGSWYHLAADGGGIENSFVMSNGGYYYLFVSKGTCCAGAASTYRIAYGRSTSMTGPYLDTNGVNMLNGGGTILDSGSARYIAPGGESVSNGAIVRHELDSQNNYIPILFINDLYFVNGWPSY